MWPISWFTFIITMVILRYDLHPCVHRDEVLLVDSGALLDPEVLAVVEIPGRGVAGQVAAVSGLLDNAACKIQ